MRTITTITDVCAVALINYDLGRHRHADAPKWDTDVIEGLERLADAVAGIQHRYQEDLPPLPDDARTAAMAMMLMSAYAEGAPLNGNTLATCVELYEQGCVPLPMLTAARPSVDVLYYCRRLGEECQRCRDRYLSCRYCERRTSPERRTP